MLSVPLTYVTLPKEIPHLEQDFHFSSGQTQPPDQAHLLAEGLLLSSRDCGVGYLLLEHMAYVRDTLSLFSRF